jgi:hypothetical protein
VIGKAASLEAALRIFHLITKAAVNFAPHQLRGIASDDPARSLPA